MNIGINDAMIDDPDEILAMIASPGPSEWYDESQIPDVSMIEPAVTVFFAVSTTAFPTVWPFD